VAVVAVVAVLGRAVAVVLDLRQALAPRAVLVRLGQRAGDFLAPDSGPENRWRPSPTELPFPLPVRDPSAPRPGFAVVPPPGLESPAVGVA
jgi:hypothetical protein